MRYVSTRGRAPALDFGDVLLAGLADDGGLYVPDRWPALDPSVWAEPRPYADVATDVMLPFVEGALIRDELAAMVADAYATFDHPEVCPVTELGDLHLLELYWGPTLAFKDVALQMVGRLFDHELRRRGDRATIVVATSGDTGSAAIEACVGRDTLDIVVLHPAGRVSDVQRRQMTTVDAPNVHNVAIEGTFDDCQDLLKAMFADAAFRDRVRLSAMNSINWARVMAQVVYYVTTVARLGRCGFTVPSGNFGNIFAGWVAERMGVPVGQLVIGSNRNDILTRWVSGGALVAEEVVPTLSPAMDIQISSNHERLLFELTGRDGTATAELLTRFRAVGAVEAPRTDRFDAAAVDDDETLATIRAVHDETGRLIDPHTAVGVAAARRCRRGEDPMVCVATAHPAKFPDAVERATGVHPPLPERLADLFERAERYDVLPNDLRTVQAHVERCVAG
ncbi:MAG TPA: threonine synthase [Acidimicrobiales bacterium]|nr:threonine synthase [Acidimicrobiales bacterium]